MKEHHGADFTKSLLRSATEIFSRW
jgi:hypothetical protein